MVRSHRVRQLATAVIALLVSTSIAGAQAKNNAKGKSASASGHFRVTAPDLTAKGRITAEHVFNGMGCTGQNVSPALNWKGGAGGNEVIRGNGVRSRRSNGKRLVALGDVQHSG